MKRKSLQELLQRYVSSYSEEKVYKRQILEFINEHPDCFERSCQIGHITASAWLLSKDGTEALMLHHKKLNRWLQLGGHCDGDGDVLAVAIKEAQEESGIQDIRAVSGEIFDIDIHLIPASPKRNEKAHYHYDVRFLLQVQSDETVVKNSESNELRWVNGDINELPTQEYSIIRMVQKWQSYNCEKQK